MAWTQAALFGQGTSTGPSSPTTITFTNTSIQISGSLPTGSNTIGAVNLAQYTPSSGRLPVFADINGTVAVSGTFWQATQPVSLASVPSHDVTNAGTFAVQAAQSGTWNLNTLTSITNPVAVTGTFWQATQPVSSTTLATVAKQPALGTAGVAAADVISVQGIAGGTALPVSGTFWQTTQPVSLATAPSTPVTNTGTFAVQAALNAETTKVIGTVNVAAAQTIAVTNAGTFATQATLQAGVNNIGDVDVLTLPALVAGTANIGDVDVLTLPSVVVGTFPDNEPFNVAQMNGVAVSMGVGASGTGTQRTAAILHDGTDTAQVTTTGGGSLQVECTSGCGGAATFVDGGAGFTQESSSVNAPSGFIVDDTIGTTLAENDIAAARITPARAQVMRIEGATRGGYATLTGTSVNVNCTGGCGSASQGQTYIANVISAASAASKDYLNLFNASGSGVVLKVLSIGVTADNTAAVSGIGFTFRINRISTAGATCTAQTIQLVDSTNAAVPAPFVTASTNCTTDPTISFVYGSCHSHSDEASVLNQGFGRDGSCYEFSNNGGQPITLREGQGINLVHNAVAPVGLATIVITFTM